MTAHISAGPFGLNTEGYTEASAHAHLNQLVGCVREMPGGADPSALTISAGGVIVPTGAHHTLLPATGTADELANATATNMAFGRWLLLCTNTNGHTITVTSNAGGTNPFRLIANLPMVMTTPDHLLLVYLRPNGSWYELARSYGDDVAAYRTFLGLAYATDAAPGLIQIATAAQFRAAVNSLIAVTPGVWAGLCGANGNGTWWRFPGNRILQMGSIVTSDSTDITVPLPQEMADATYHLSANTMTVGAIPGGRLVAPYGKTATNFKLVAYTTAGARSALQVSWEVKGFEKAP